MLQPFYKLFILTAFSLYSYQGLAFSTLAKQAIVMDYNSDAVIFEHNAYQAMPPSSMSKLMTLYVALNKLKEGSITEDTICRTSNKAWKIKGSSMFLAEGQKVNIKALLEGIIVVSGNDAAITLAECISANEENFVEQMNNMGKKLSLRVSNFTNSSGWPAAHHQMSAHDVAKLAMQIFKDFPSYYHIFSQKDFTFNKVKQRNTNDLIFKNIGVDGVKTGHTEAGGYGIVASATRNNQRIFVVVNGLSSGKERMKEAENLLNYAFSNFTTKTLFSAGDKVTALKIAKNKTVDLVVKDNVIVTYNNKDKIKSTINLTPNFSLPIKEGQVLGQLEVEVPLMGIKSFNLHAAKSIPAPWWYKWWNVFNTKTAK